MEICLQFHKHAQENNKINSPFAIRRRYYVVSLTLFGIWAQFTCSSKCMKINKTSRRQNVPESSGKVLNPEKTMFPLYSRQTNLQKASRIVKGKHSASFDSFQPLLMWLKLSVSLARTLNLARPSRAPSTHRRERACFHYLEKRRGGKRGIVEWALYGGE